MTMKAVAKFYLIIHISLVSEEKISAIILLSKTLCEKNVLPVVISHMWAGEKKTVNTLDPACHQQLPRL
jgi:hypothetical protein